MTMETDFNLPFPEKVDIMILIYSWSHGGELIRISIINKFKLMILILRLLHMVHQDRLDQEKGLNILDITHIQVKELI